MSVEEVAEALCVPRMRIRRYLVIFGYIEKRPYVKKSRLVDRDEFKRRWDALGPERVFQGLLRLLREG